MVMVIVTADDVVVAAPSGAMGNVLLVRDTRPANQLMEAIKDIVVVVLRIAHYGLMENVQVAKG